MKFCQPHWNQLRAAIDAAGMGNLGAKNGREAIERVKSELNGTETDETFDPLMAAHNAIVEEFLKPLGAAGMYLFTGDYCPLCELDRLNPGRNLPENWIKGVTGQLLKYCTEKGLVSGN